MIHALRMGLAKNTNLPSFVAFLAISALILTLLNGSLISDEQGSKGFFAKQESLSKGIIYKKTNMIHLTILAIYTVLLLFGNLIDGLSSSIGSITLLILIMLNLLVPPVVIFMLDPERQNKM